jgi:hypothetical protein
MTTENEEIVWGFIDIEKTQDGWMVVRMGYTLAGGVQVKEPIRLFMHSNLDPQAARFAAHRYAFHTSNLTDRRYLA